MVGQQLKQADLYGDELSTKRSELLERYMSEPYGDERSADAGFSQVIDSSVSDTVEWIMPDMMRTFTAGENVVEFQAFGAEDEDAARQETDVVNHVFNHQNEGFIVLHEMIKDALIQKTGVVKWWWHEEERTREEDYENQSQDQLLMVMDQMQQKYAEGSEIEIVEQESRQIGVTYDLSGNEVPELEFDVKIKITEMLERARVEAVPPEDFLIQPRFDSINLTDCPFVAHRIRTTVGDLVAQGYDEEQVKKLPTNEGDEYLDERDRRFDQEETPEESEIQFAGEAMRPVSIFECYMRVDWNNDGVAELCKIVTSGSGGQKSNGGILTRDGDPDIEEVEEIPFAAITPVLMSHRFYGRSIAELVDDLQRIKTVLMRQMLDNVYMVANPSVEVPEGAMGDDTIDDLLTIRPQRIIRTKMPGMMREIAPPPFMDQILPALTYVDETRESRSGVTKYSQGLDAENLNQTASGINRIMSASQLRIELISRVFAETGIKRMFVGLHGMMRRHSSKALTMKLRNEWVEVDPRHWRERQDMTVTVGLGSGNKDQMLAQLSYILQVQKEAIAGQSPLCDWGNVYNTLRSLIENAGLKNPELYFTDPSKVEQPQQQQPQGDPATMALAQAEMMKVELEKQKMQMNAQMDQKNAALEQQRIAMEDDRERDKADRDFWLKAKELELKYGTEIDKAMINAQVQADRNQMQSSQPQQGVSM